MKKEMNNKGFSLVELIIVIAIMAVLVGVLAPQYLKYVNNSKVSTDITNAGNINTAISAGIADGTVTATNGFGTNASTLPTGLSITQWPASKVSGSTTWTYTANEEGVSQITLDGTEIFPNSDLYKDAHWK